MSNIISPLSTSDFSASIAEVSPYLVNQLVELINNAWSTVHFVLADHDELTVTTEAVSQLNLSILNIAYMEVQGGTEHRYTGARVNSVIVLPLEETGSTFGAYSAPLGSARLPDHPNGYHPEDCTLLESHSLDEPIFVGCELDGAELVYSFQVPEDTRFKALLIFVNENTIPE